jgi:tRNA U34 5-methylaminomethyl-2-thiouridine-forming methyltransferase MnmC
MKREIITTKDGSKTIHLPEWNENYHSHHGAVQEALHVFIKSGLEFISASKMKLSILEVGFGTGLNAILTFKHGIENQLSIQYHGLEAFPVSSDEIDLLDYISLSEIHEHKSIYQLMHSLSWNENNAISANFELLKSKIMLADYKAVPEKYDLVYFDAFGPRVQPDLWEKAIFSELFKSLKSGGVFVTYCAKGQVRRDLLEVGFNVEKIPGPPGKREMLRATKPDF